MKNDEELKNELMRDFEANINVKTNKNNDYSFFETLDDDLFPDETVDRNIYDVFEEFLKNDDKYVLQIIGLPGIGKTYQLKKILNEWLENFPVLDEDVYCNIKIFNKTKAAKDLSEIKDQKYVFIDGVNELNPEQEKTLLEKINLSLETAKQQKFILTSWDKIEINFPKQETLFPMQSNPDVEKLLIHFDLENVSEQNKYIFSTLTYRQLIFLFENCEIKKKYKRNITKIIKGNAWDGMQKVFENLINYKVNITNEKIKKWKYFKKHFVLNNDNWPFIKKTQIDEQWESELIRLAIIQRKGDEYYINNGVFLLPVRLRKYINKNATEWLDEYMTPIEINRKSFIDKMIIIVRYLVARKDIKAIQWLLKRKEMQYFPASKISETIFNFSEKMEGIKKNFSIPILNPENLYFDTLCSLLDFFPFITDQTALNLVCSSDIITFNETQNFPNFSSKKYSQNRELSQFKKLLIGIVMYICQGWDETSDGEIWRLFNGEIFKGIQPINNKYLFTKTNIYSEKMLQFLIIEGFKYFKLSICDRSEAKEIFKTIKKQFFLKQYSEDPKKDIKNFETKVENYLKKHYQHNRYRFFYWRLLDILHWTKPSIHFDIAYSLNKINSFYENDRYKNKFVIPLIKYTISLSEKEISSNPDQPFKSKNSKHWKQLEISEMMIEFFIKYMLTGNFVCKQNNTVTPYLEIFENTKNQEIKLMIDKIEKNWLNTPLFLKKHNILDIYEQTIINKNGIKFYPIHLMLIKDIFFKNHKYTNKFITKNQNIRTISSRKLSSNNWWIPSEKQFPFLPTKGLWKFNKEKFLLFEKRNQKIWFEAIYTSEWSLINRFYEFYADSMRILLPYKLNNHNNQIYKEGQIYVNHATKDFFNTLDEYRKNNPVSGLVNDEYKKYLTDEELKKEEEIEEYENNL